MRAVVAGWFSYEEGHATAGDLLACDLVCEWLTELGIEHVTAVAPPFSRGMRLDDIDPGEFTHALFVCGPFGRNRLESDFLGRFAGCRLIGVNLSLERPPDEWQPFDFVIERDSIRATNADLVFASRNTNPPVVGVCLLERDPRVDVPTANAAIGRLLERHEAARVPIDTRLDVNEAGLRTKGEIEALIGRMDLLVTTRLHGLVIGLRNRVPVVAVDAVPGGGKVSRQAKRIGWPNLLGLDELDDERLDRAFAFALSDEARRLAAESAEAGVAGVERVRARVAGELTRAGSLEARYASRQTEGGMAAFLGDIAPLPQAGPGPFHRRVARRLRRMLQVR